MGFLDIFTGAGSAIKAVGDIADDLITTDSERLELEIKKQEVVLGAMAKEEEEVSKRWTSDMNSDSWLSKNIRPLTLIYILTAYTVFSVGSAFDLTVTPEYVQLMGQWGMLIMGAYFGGRTAEKIMQMRKPN